MALPKLTVPTYTLTVPSTKKKVKFRPFLSKEEKILMLVKQSNNQDEIMTAMKDVVNVCTFEKLDIEKLALFDIEYIFLQLRAKSIGEVIEVDMKCVNKVKHKDEFTGETEKDCGGIIPFAINIEDIAVEFGKDHQKVIKLEKDIGVTMRYPSVEDIEMIESNKEDDIDIIAALIESIYDKDNVYEVAETKPEEFQAFVDNISSKQIEEIREKFFYTIPVLEHKAKYKCPKCSNEGEYTFRGMQDFF